MAEDSIETPFKFSLVGPGLTVQRDLTQSAALAALQVALGGAPQVLPGSSNEKRLGFGGGDARRLSLREYMEEAGAKSYPSKVVVVGRYLRDVEGQPDFSREETKDRFRSAGEPPASNLPRDFTVAVANGWIAEDHERNGRFYVTRRGDEAADGRFEGGTPTSRSRRKRKSGHSGSADGAPSDGDNHETNGGG
jgi:hypothetical protein